MAKIFASKWAMNLSKCSKWTSRVAGYSGNKIIFGNSVVSAHKRHTWKKLTFFHDTTSEAINICCKVFQRLKIGLGYSLTLPKKVLQCKYLQLMHPGSNIEHRRFAILPIFRYFDPNFENPQNLRQNGLFWRKFARFPRGLATSVTLSSQTSQAKA